MTKITFIPVIFLYFFHSISSNPIFSDLPPVIVEENQNHETTNTHTTIFNPMGKYATDVQYLFVRLPIFFNPIMDAQRNILYQHKAILDAVHNKTVEHPIKQIVSFSLTTIQDIIVETRDLLDKLPNTSEYGSRKKRFLDLLFGIAGTAFGIANSVQIAKINTLLGSEIHRVDMMVDVQQLHENHLHSIDLQMINISEILSDFVAYNPAAISAFLNTMTSQLRNILDKASDALEQAQVHRLSHKIFSNDVLVTIKEYIDKVAKKNNYISFIKHTSDLFQIETSYVYQPANHTVSLILHVPLVKPDYLLNLHQYLPFPLSHNLSPNHSLTPSVGQHDILAYSGYETFKIVSQSDLAACTRMGDTYFCKGRNDLRTDIKNTCLGSLYLQQTKGVQKYCQFEIQPASERVFRIEFNKWTISTQQQYTTHKVCDKTRTPVMITSGTTIELQPGCKIRLQTHILYAESIEEITITPTHFTWTWNASQIFPALKENEFAYALQSLRDYGLHVVDAADIAHHLKFSNFQDSIPSDITNLMTNPFNYMTTIIVFIIIGIILYVLYKCYSARKPLPHSYPVQAPSAPGIPLVQIRY
jgi:hypothetical protein